MSYLFTYSLFNDSVYTSEYIGSNNRIIEQLIRKDVGEKGYNLN
jgi:hypothetical protein